MPDSAELKRPPHPGSGRRRAPTTPKGRQLDPRAFEEISGLLADRGLGRDLLIEHLHAIQDAFGHLAARHLVALADLMRLSLVEVYEVATFYAHFDVVDENEQPPAPVTIRVCDSLTCACLGAEQLREELEAQTNPAEVRVLRAPCMGRCHAGPTLEVGKRHLDQASVEGTLAFLDSGEAHKPIMPDYQSYEAYEAEGGYALLRACLKGEQTPEALITEMQNSKLRGLGGAGFPSGLKWAFVRKEAGPRLMAVNGDEGEPGTFKDRHYLETRPHQFLEGLLIAAWVAEATDCYLYMRDEYPAVLSLLRAEMRRVQDAGLAGHVKLHLRRGAGAYICGEESAMLESIEGKRGIPRHKPPYPTQVGLFGRPTLIHNVETLYWVPQILREGADWFAGQGLNGRQGLRSFSVSGRVKVPGVKLAPAGITLRQLIDDYCGGMAEGHQLKAYLPGGASGGILPASKDDIPLDFGTLEAEGCFIGSAAVIVLSDQDKMQEVGRNLMAFFADESCGQCTPCRVGTEKALALMGAESWDVELLKELSVVMRDSSICGLGQAAPNPLDSIVKHFGDEL